MEEEQGKKTTALGKELVIILVPSFPTELRLIAPQGPQA